jgi:hypothetical protein
MYTALYLVVSLSSIIRYDDIVPSPIGYIQAKNDENEIIFRFHFRGVS